MQGGSQAQRGLLERRIDLARDGEAWDTRQVVTVGNSAAVTIPDGLRRLFGIEQGDEVTVYKCDGGYFIQPAEDGDSDG